MSAAITADSLPSATKRVVVPPSVHPIQENPTIMIPTAPTTAPQTAGLIHTGTCIGRLLGDVSFGGYLTLSVPPMVDFR